MKNHSWKFFRAGRVRQVSFTSAADLENLAELDRRRWLVVSMPTEGVRFDRRMLELIDTDRDGRIRFDEILGAVDFLKKSGIDLSEVFAPPADLEAKLADVMAREADLTRVAPTPEETSAFAAWEAQGQTPEVAVFGEGTEAAEAALAAVEPTVEAFFAPPDDLSLVTDGPERRLPLDERVNPRYRLAMLDFAARCVKPILGERTDLGFADWQAVKARFAAYRAWRVAKPALRVAATAKLEDEERTIRYRLHLLELLENFVNLRRLYQRDSSAIFQTGTLRIDGREFGLCFHVADDAAHAALAKHAECCLLYVKLTRPSDHAVRTICAVVTSGAIAPLYVGRNGVFVDRDGQPWEATVIRLVENQVSLWVAFWLPWKRVGEAISSVFTKFLGDRQAAAVGSVSSVATKPVSAPASSAGGQQGGAALASSVAAVGIGIGMVGAAAASLMAAVARLSGMQLLISVACLIALVSLPSVILTWFKLRRRDLGAVLNASGWAVNHPLRLALALVLLSLGGTALA